MIALLPLGRPLRELFFYDGTELDAVRHFSHYYGINYDLVVFDSLSSRRGNRLDEYCITKILKKSKISSILKSFPVASHDTC